MKKIVSTVICVVMMLSLTACDKSIKNEQLKNEQLKSALLNGYDEVTFVELLDEFAAETIRKTYKKGVRVDYRIEYKEGWKTDNLDAEMLNDDEEAVTYSVIFDANIDGVVERTTVRYFAILYKETDMLDIRGLYLNEDGDVEEIYDSEEIDEILKDIFDEL